MRTKLETARAALATTTKKKKGAAPKPAADCIWFIEPRGEHTNEVLSKTENVAEEGWIKDADGKDRFLYRMASHAEVENFRRSEGKYLLFKVFRRIGNGRYEEVKDWMNGRHREKPKQAGLAKAA